MPSSNYNLQASANNYIYKPLGGNVNLTTVYTDQRNVNHLNNNQNNLQQGPQLSNLNSNMNIVG